MASLHVRTPSPSQLPHNFSFLPSSIPYVPCLSGDYLLLYRDPYTHTPLVRYHRGASIPSALLNSIH